MSAEIFKIIGFAALVIGMWVIGYICGRNER